MLEVYKLIARDIKHSILKDSGVWEGLIVAGIIVQGIGAIFLILATLISLLAGFWPTFPFAVCAILLGGGALMLWGGNQIRILRGDDYSTLF